MALMEAAPWFGTLHDGRTDDADDSPIPPKEGKGKGKEKKAHEMAAAAAAAAAAATDKAINHSVTAPVATAPAPPLTTLLHTLSTAVRGFFPLRCRGNYSIWPPQPPPPRRRRRRRRRRLRLPPPPRSGWLS